MIRLLSIPKPKILTDEYVREKTTHFKATGEKVWGSGYVVSALLEMGRNKCAYCECNIAEESKYMEVEHFKPKALYPDDVLDWDNLLPACKRCNIAKLNHDVVAQPIVNPRSEVPGDHLRFKGALLVEKNAFSKGKTTYEVLKLNDPERLIKARLQISEQIDNILVDWQQRLRDVNPLHPSEWPRLQRQMGRFLEEAAPSKDYAAFTATYLLQHSTYWELRNALIKIQFWTTELEAAEQTARDLALFP